MNLIPENWRWVVAEMKRRAGTVSNAPAILFLRALVTLVCLATLAPIHAQQSDSLFIRTEAMIPMRDGVRLHTQVYTPTRATERLPILLLRTPYGIGDLSSERLAAALPELSADGYVFVRQDIRGRFKSEGQFVMLRQPRDPKDTRAIDESTDAYDTIEWLLAHVSNHNGSVGMAGTSTLAGRFAACDGGPGRQRRRAPDAGLDRGESPARGQAFRRALGICVVA